MTERLTEIKGPLEDPLKRPKQLKQHPLSRQSGLETKLGWKGSLSSRARVSKKLPQAVLKITSHNSGRKNVLNRLNYISREGELNLETDEGLLIEGKKEISDYLDQWTPDFSTRKNGRDGMSLVLSVPHGTEREAAIKSARVFD